MQKRTAALEKLVGIIDRLRAPDGCPWDRAQTLRDMARYLLEEVAEAVDAIDHADGKATPQVCEELGDVLMNVLLSSRIAQDEGAFDAGDVAEGIAEKLVRRHPHVFESAVFGKTSVESVDEVLTNWNAIKDAERKGKTDSSESTSRLDKVPRSLPVLERADSLARQAAKVGFDWPDARGAFEKVLEESEEVGDLLKRRDAGRQVDRLDLEDELGDLLFAVVNLCRKLEVPAARALRRTLRKFCERFRAVEASFPEIDKATLEEMEAVWQQAKHSGDSGETPSRGEED